MRLGQRARFVLLGTAAVLVALIATAFAIGGSGSGSKESAGAGSTSAAIPFAAGHVQSNGGVAIAGGSSPVLAPGLPSIAPDSARKEAVEQFSTTNSLGATSGSSGAGSGSSNSADNSATVTDASSVDATRIVKTGELTVRVQKNAVQSVTQALTTLAAAQGGYVASSSTNLGAGEPSGEVVLRIPVAHFDAAVTKAETFGHVVSITTSADDVTGKYVDLNAKEHALERSRSTYLSILSRATTIGATLSVQQRIDDIQQQIDSLHGQIKLLGNQSSYSTLTVDVVPVGAPVLLAAHHSRHGLGKAWHDSWSRFSRGIDALVGAIGPIVFALLLLALIAAIGTIGYRGVRKVVGQSSGTA